MDAVTILTSIITSATVTTAIVAVAQKLITSKIELRQQEKLEAVKAQISRRYQEEVEVIKSNLAADLEKFKYANSSLSSVYLSSNTERVIALKSAWELHLEVKVNIPFLVIAACNFLTKASVLDLRNFNGSDEMRNAVKTFSSQKYLNAITPISKSLEKLKPFIGLELWGLQLTYISIIGRITLETGESIIKEYQPYFWLDDEHLINNIITKIMTYEKFAKIVNEGRLLNGLLDYIELEIVELISSQLTGKAFSLDQVKLAADIKSGTNPTKQG